MSCSLAPGQVTVSVNRSQVLATALTTGIGIHASVYDNYLTNTKVPGLLDAAGVGTVRYPGRGLRRYLPLVEPHAPDELVRRDEQQLGTVGNSFSVALPNYNIYEYILTPVPEPSGVMVVVGVGIVTLARRRGVRPVKRNTEHEPSRISIRRIREAS